MKTSNQLFILGVCSLLFFSACKRCDESRIVPCKFVSEMESYFGMYKPGNWWVYKNTTGTKYDSIYVTDYKDSMVTNVQFCYKMPQRTLLLQTQHYLSYSPISIYYGIIYYNNENIIQFDADHSNTKPGFGIGFKDGKWGEYTRDDSIYVLGSYHAGKCSQDFRFGMFSKNLGLVCYTQDQDTFLLTNYLIH